MYRAFTLIELTIVLGIILALVAVTLPAFRSLKESNRESGGVNAVGAALNEARALAVKNGHDVAIMFTFDIEKQIAAMQLVEIDSTTHDAGNGLGRATIFKPIDGHAPIQLPQGAAVFGFGYGASRNGTGTADPDNRENWYADLPFGDNSYYGNNSTQDPWLFPRTDVRLFSKTFDQADTHPEFLESFVIRFDSTGTVVSGTEELGLGTSSSAHDGFLELDHLNTDIPGWEDDLRAWTPQKIDLGGGKVRIIGEAQLRSVPFIAVVDLYRIADETGLRSPWLALNSNHKYGDDEKIWDSDGDGDEDHIEIDRWINENASIISFNRYSGAIMKEHRR